MFTSHPFLHHCPDLTTLLVPSSMVLLKMSIHKFYPVGHSTLTIPMVMVYFAVHIPMSIVLLSEMIGSSLQGLEV